MSFVHKLWKIGRALSEEDIRDSISDDAENIDGKETNFLNINFKISNEKIENISLSRESIKREKLLFTKKIGGTSNSFYLYPNINIQNGLPKEKIQLIVVLVKHFYS